MDRPGYHPASVHRISPFATRRPSDARSAIGQTPTAFPNGTSLSLARFGYASAEGVADPEVAQSTIPDHILFTHNKLPKMICDKNKVDQIFRNLFDNAVIHGEITSEITVISEDTKSERILLVSNNGKPIPPEIQTKIFQRGFTTQHNHMGLGLAIVKKLVEAHGWQICVEPSTKLTTFRITIPFSAINIK